MNLEYINAFTMSMWDILKNYLNIDSRKGAVEVKANTAPFKGVAVLVGITGTTTGKVIFDMDRDTGFRLTTKFNDEFHSEVNDIFIATLKEFGNVVCGKAITNMGKAGDGLDLTTPTLILGEHMVLAEERGTEIIMVSFHTDIGQIDINVIINSVTRN
ncbi:MAG: chemotaxis protein CheX [Spirochaetes bacterium]|nr:chemotaxis protein CheX [Spirochaetota bacterium]